MKFVRNILITLCILGVGLITTAYAGLVYQDFEPGNGSSQYGWPINGAEASLTSLEGHSGTQSWMIVSPVNYGGAGIPSQVDTYNMDFEPGRHDRLTFWIKAIPADSSENDVRVRFFDHGLYNVGGYEVFTTRTAQYNQWTRCDVLFSQLPLDFDLTTIDKLHFVNAIPGVYFIDDIQVVSSDRVYQAFEPQLRSGSTVSEYGWKWNDADSVDFSAPGEPVYEGQHSWKLVTADFWGGTGIQSQEKKLDSGVQTFWHVDLNPAQNDRLTFWVYSQSENGLDNNIGVQFYDHDQHATDETKAVVWTQKRAQYGHWTKLTVLFNELPSTLNLEDLNKIQFQVYWPGTYYFDDIRATKELPAINVFQDPNGLMLSWNAIPGAGVYELQESQDGPEGPWQTISEGSSLLGTPYWLSSKWYRVRWKESTDAANPLPYISDWSDAVKMVGPLPVLHNPSNHLAGLEWDDIPGMGPGCRYQVQKSYSKDGPWSDIYVGPQTLLPSSTYYEEGAWYRLRAHIMAGPNFPEDVGDSSDWSAALQLTALGSGYLRVAGEDVKEMDGTGSAVTLRGVNLGNLLLIEPEFTGIGGDYTPLNINDDDDYSIRAELMNRFGSADLLNTYQEAYLTKDDFDYIARAGFNLVRVPIYYKALQDATGAFTNFAKLDWIMEECSNRGIYVLLDLHGAPGAQSDEIHSGRMNYNKLFEDSPEGEAYRAATITLWTALANRYIYYDYLLGYDLLNEPFGALDHDPSLVGSNGLWTLYHALYGAIRAVDPYHIIVMESIPSEFDWDTLPSPTVYGWENVMYQFHYYGFEFDAGGNISGIKDIPGHRAYIEDKVKNSDQDVFDVPVFIGEFNGFNQRENWDYFLNTFSRKNWHWAMWTYKAHQQQYATEWGLFMHEGYDDAPADVSTDSEIQLEQKFSKYDTAGHHVLNLALDEIIRSHLQNLHPQLGSLNDPVGYENSLVKLIVRAVDPQGGSVSLSAAMINDDPLDTIGAVFTDYGNGSGLLSWQPGAGQAGESPRITLRATDPDGWSDAKTLTVDVAAGGTPVVWQDLVGVTADVNTLTKTNPAGWGNGGAASAQILSGDGGVVFTVSDMDKRLMCGLSDSNPDEHFLPIQYAIYLNNNGTVSVFESSFDRGVLTTYQAGDRFSIERTGSSIEYMKNDVVFYTSTVLSSGPLLVDTSFYDTAALISNVVLLGYVPGPPEAVTDLTASGGDGEMTLTWSAPSNNGSAISGYVVQYGTVVSGLFDNTYNDDAVPGATVSGLTNGTEYQFRVIATNGYGDSPESNVATATPHQIITVDVTWLNLVGVTANGNTITKTALTGWGNAGAASSQTFSGDGGLEFLATETNTYRMCGLSDSNPDANFTSIDYAVYLASGGAVYVYENGTSRGTFGTYQSGDRFSVERTGSTVVYKKNGTTFYTSTVASSGTLMADAAIHTTGGTVSDAKMNGVTLGAPNAVSDLTASGGDGAITLTWSAPSNNGSAISGYVVQYGTVASGLFDNTYNDDAVPGATVSGLTNGTEYQFRVIATNGYGDSPESNVATATPHQIITVDVTWLNLVGVTANGNTITKTALTGWGNAGAASSQTFSGDGGLEFLATETNTYRMCGLSDSNPDANFTSIDYAVYLASGGAVYVYENGTSRGTFGTYQSGDRFSVERTGSTVVYKKNGTTFYTSTVASSGTLMADAAIHTTGGTVSDAKMSGVTLGAPNAVADLTASGGDGEVTLTWSAPSNNGSAISGYVVQYGTVASGLFDNTYNDDAVPGATVSGLTNGTEYQFRVIATNGYGDSPESNVATATPHQIITVDVTWLNLVGVTANGNTITKTALTGWGNAGAASSQTFSGDGGLEFLATETNTYRMCGLSDSNPDANFTSIDYAVYLASGGAVYVYENGTSRGTFGTYQSGDRFSVERTGSTVVYKKNGTTFYTSTVASSGTLMADAAIHTTGGTVSDAKMNGVTLGAPNAVSDLTASGGDGEVTLTWSAPSNNGSAISGYVVQYGTVASGLFDNTYNDDAVPGATVSGLTNGTEYQFRVIATNGYGDSPESNVATATPHQITTVDVTWLNLVGVTANGNTITKTALTGWGNAGAASSQTFSGDGGLEFLATETNTYRMCGLSDSNPDANFTSIDYAVYLASGGAVYVYENGTSRGTFGTYQSGDRFSVERTGSTVVYKKNGTTFYTSTVASSGTLMADAAIHTTGGTVSDAKMSGVTLGAPNAVADLTASGGDGEVTLTWSAPSNNGSAISGYVVQYGTVVSGLFDNTYNDDAVPGATVSGLTNGTEYQFRVIATNGYGDSPESNAATATPHQIITVDVTWLNLVGATANGNTITKTAGTAWGNAGAASSQTFSGDGRLEFLATQVNTSRMCGLSDSNPDANFTSIDYAVYLYSGGAVYIFESGTNRGIFGTYQSGDRFSVERMGTTVVYKKNGSVFYTSTVASSGVLMADAAIHTSGGKVESVQLIY